MRRQFFSALLGWIPCMILPRKVLSILMAAMTIEELLIKEGWTTEAVLSVDGQEARFANLDPSLVAPATSKFAKKLHPNGLFLHQQIAVEQFAAGNNVCLTTATASGKTTLFHLAAVEVFAREPKAKIVCLYPLKALASEQEQRWQVALDQFVKDGIVGRIAGDVSTKVRGDILRRSHVVVMTPDVMHAWMLPNSEKKSVQGFLKNLRLVVVDEAHAYTGVFGSNSAFLFRRLRHLASALGEEPRFVAASATIANPGDHLQKLIGVDFALVGEEHNGSKRYPSNIRLVNPPNSEDLMTSLPRLFGELGKQDRKTIAFVDSRKQVELLTSIATRGELQEETQPNDGGQTASDEAEVFEGLEDSLDLLKKLSILPYRSGYEERDRKLIQSRLQAGHLSGVISTSALELGIDIPHLDTGVLVGVPASSTSLRQRIGRIGRHQPGEVLVINTGSIYDQSVFAEPETLLTRPPAESALYLENRRIQYIHALCLARLGGEHDSVTSSPNEDFGFTSKIEFPDGFIELCKQERVGQIDVELQSMKSEAGESPHHVFPLRDVETQFKITFKQGPEETSLGQISYSQVLREAYPGAVYRYATRAYRVYLVNLRSKEIRVRAEKAYVTRPSVLPTLVFPNLTEGNIYQVAKNDKLVIAEANLQIREWIGGFSERRGSTEYQQQYPISNAAASLHYPHPTFFRNYFTSGLIFFHPALDEEGVNRELLNLLLFEAFLYVVPFERSDISSAPDKLRTDWKTVEKGRRFLSIFDSTYGSLRLSGRLMDSAVLDQAFDHLEELATLQNVEGPTLAAAIAISNAAKRGFTFTPPETQKPQATSEDYVQVIQPDSWGLHMGTSNEQYQITKVFWNAKEGELFYKGILESERHEDTFLLTPVSRVLTIPGLSVLTFYNLATGELEDR
jgi:DEAD/DEAH box helicase domain-containing protein